MRSFISAINWTNSWWLYGVLQLLFYKCCRGEKLLPNNLIHFARWFFECYFINGLCCLNAAKTVVFEKKTEDCFFCLRLLSRNLATVDVILLLWMIHISRFGIGTRKALKIRIYLQLRHIKIMLNSMNCLKQLWLKYQCMFTWSSNNTLHDKFNTIFSFHLRFHFRKIV